MADRETDKTEPNKAQVNEGKARKFSANVLPTLQELYTKT